MKPLSWFLIGFVTILAGLAHWVRANPYDIGGAVARTVPTLLTAFAIAYVVRGRKSKRNWESFARWYFWLALVLSILSVTLNP
jgi:uncharacterized membrane protein